MTYSKYWSDFESKYCDCGNDGTYYKGRMETTFFIFARVSTRLVAGATIYTYK
jgi:hypothetical protein